MLLSHAHVVRVITVNMARASELFAADMVPSFCDFGNLLTGIIWRKFWAKNRSVTVGLLIHKIGSIDRSIKFIDRKNSSIHKNSRIDGKIYAHAHTSRAKRASCSRARNGRQSSLFFPRFFRFQVPAECHHPV